MKRIKYDIDMKTKEEILAEVTDRELYELRDKGVTPIIDVDDICTAMDAYATQQVYAATANHDQEMVEFGKYCQHHRYTSPKTALITFRQSNGG